MKKITIQLDDIQLSQLNNECLKMVATFVRLLKADKGVSLRMQDSDILTQISKQSHRSKNPQLKVLYTDLKVEILKSMHQVMSK